MQAIPFDCEEKYGSHCNIGFSLIDPVVLSCKSTTCWAYKNIIKTCCKMGLIGRLGMTHQYITSQAVKNASKMLSVNDFFDLFKNRLVTGRRLIIGVLYSDAGMCSVVNLRCKRIEILRSEKYPVPLTGDGVVDVISDQELCENSSDKIDYLREMDCRFRCYPSNWKQMSLAMIGKKTKNNMASYYLATEDELQHVHSMAPNKNLCTLQQIVSRILLQAKKWFEFALKHNDMYFIGRIFHMIQDSYSEAHMKRECDGEHKFTVVDIYQYDTQNKKHHSEMDSITRILSEQNQARLNMLVYICSSILVLFHNRNELEFESFMISVVYRFHSSVNTLKIAKNK